MYISLVGLILGMCCVIYLIKLIVTFKKRIDKQNIKLLHAYLDRKLLSKIISIIKSDNCDVLENAMNLISTYYDLTQIAIYCNQSKNFLYHPNNNKWLLERYVSNNLDKMSDVIQKKHFFTDNIDVVNQKFILHITAFEEGKDNFLILLRQDSSFQNEVVEMLDSVKEMIILILHCLQKPV